MEKIAFITASSSGLGFQIALDLSKRGYIVILNGRNKKKLKKAKEKLHNKDLHHIFCCDLVYNKMIQKLDKFFKKINILPHIIIHSLGGKIAEDKHPISIEILNQSMNLNLYSSILINNYFIPQFIENKNIQKIIHISSSASINGNASPSYAISKGALNIYIKNSARFYALDNISFCGIIPNIIIHENSDWGKKKKENNEYYTKRLNEMPLKEFATPAQLSPYICALCDIDNMHNTGSLIELQGGV